MTLPVTNASRGRSFSKLAIVKIRLKKQTESPVSDLSIERDILRKLDFISLIKEFSVCRSVGLQKYVRGRGSNGEFTLVSVSLLFK